MPDNNDQVTSGLRSLLRLPAVYLFFQYLMNSHGKYRMCLERFLKPVHGKRILDIGCGCADILTLLPPDVHYVGYDLSAEYIAYARNKFGSRAVFYNQRVNDITISGSALFDIVIADGLLHHLNDFEAAELFALGSKVLCDTGFMFTADPTLIENQGFISRWISLTDRGKHVRSPDDYKRIAQDIFPHVEAHVIHNVSNRPQTGCFMRCYKNAPRQENTRDSLA